MRSQTNAFQSLIYDIFPYGKGVMVLTYEQIVANTKLKDLFIEIQNHILTLNDKALIANVLDKSGHLIISCDSLKELISTALDSEVEVDVQEDPQKRSCNCCGKGKLNLQVFGSILSITIDGKNLEEAEPSLYKYLTKTWNISLTRTYLPRMFEYEPEVVARSTHYDETSEEESD